MTSAYELIEDIQSGITKQIGPYEQQLYHEQDLNVGNMPTKVLKNEVKQCLFNPL